LSFHYILNQTLIKQWVKAILLLPTQDKGDNILERLF
jgi:hypothetical protein